jgi:uncharacterized glyoxalase superfamily protein PhnB
MASDTSNNLQLELHVPDFEMAKDFYGKLGFEVVWKRQKGDAGDYMVMNRKGTIINFWPGNKHVWEQPYFKDFPKDTKRGYGVEIVFNVENVTEYYEKVKQFAKIVEPLKKKPWGLYDFRLEDPFGFYLRIGEPHNILDPGNAVD